MKRKRNGATTLIDRVVAGREVSQTSCSAKPITILKQSNANSSFEVLFWKVHMEF